MQPLLRPETDPDVRQVFAAHANEGLQDRPVNLDPTVQMVSMVQWAISVCRVRRHRCHRNTFINSQSNARAKPQAVLQVTRVLVAHPDRWEILERQAMTEDRATWDHLVQWVSLVVTVAQDREVLRVSQVTKLPEMKDHLARQDSQEDQAMLDLEDLPDHLAPLVNLEHQETTEHLVSQVHLGNQVTKVHLDHREAMARGDVAITVHQQDWVQAIKSHTLIPEFIKLANPTFMFLLSSRLSPKFQMEMCNQRTFQFSMHFL